MLDSSGFGNPTVTTGVLTLTATARLIEREDTRYISAVHLQNIGPYDDLTLDLSEGWNIILGDNGVGKTTLLRAIATALCGPTNVSPRTLQALLRVGQVTGSIEIRAGDSIQNVMLTRQVDGSVAARSDQASMIEQGRWVVVGFPALRGVITSQALSVAGVGASRPSYADLIPLIEGEIDGRLADVKQWVVNTYVAGGLEFVSSFFELITSFFPSYEIELTGIDSENKEVYVDIGDGSVPLDRLSQGLSSLLSWVGLTLQRMLDVYGESASSPSLRSALVIVDELDAHLHPEWQRQLVSTIAKHMPKLQVIGSTHSPLVANAVEPSSIHIAERFGSSIILRTATPEEVPDLSMMRADQVLTSSLFGLSTTRTPGARSQIDRYAELVGRAQWSPAEQGELATLGEHLTRGLMNAETSAGRLAEHALDLALQKATDPAAFQSQLGLAARMELQMQLEKVGLREALSEPLSTKKRARSATKKPSGKVQKKKR